MTLGSWIFVSHAHRDLEKVRRIRNERERRGHNPLLFFLKCLEAADARPPELIRDEIKARTFFVLWNTRTSRRSKWVKQEIELVKQVTKRPRQTVGMGSATVPVAPVGVSPTGSPAGRRRIKTVSPR